MHQCVGQSLRRGANVNKFVLVKNNLNQISNQIEKKNMGWKHGATCETLVFCTAQVRFCTCAFTGTFAHNLYLMPQDVHMSARRPVTSTSAVFV